MGYEEAEKKQDQPSEQKNKIIGNVIQGLIKISNEPDGAEKLGRFAMVGAMIIFLAIFFIYAIVKLSGF